MPRLIHKSVSLCYNTSMGDMKPMNNEPSLRMPDALSNLRERLMRFTQSGAPPPPPDLTPERRRDAYIGTLIMERDEAFSEKVANKYAQYREPFKTLGEDSIVARRIAYDERLLLAAYNLFKAAEVAEDEIGKGITFLRDTDITTPLSTRSEYTTGEDFVYLRAYLMFEQLVTDYVPQFEAVKEGYVLTFVRPSAVRETFRTREIIAAIKASYKSDKENKESGKEHNNDAASRG